MYQQPNTGWVFVFQPEVFETFCYNLDKDLRGTNTHTHTLNLTRGFRFKRLKRGKWIPKIWTEIGITQKSFRFFFKYSSHVVSIMFNSISYCK